MTTGMGRPSVRAASIWLLAALLTVALAACAPAAGTGITTAGEEDAGILYAQCMRDSGVPDFPDPGAEGQFSLGHGEGDHDPYDPTLRAAMEECRDLRPAGADHQDFGDPEFVVQMFDFAQCMRENGLPDFPDPDADGRLVLGHGEIDRNDPRFQAAMRTCYESVPGVAH